MKKLIAFVLCCGMALCLSACGGSGSSGYSGSSADKQNSESTESVSSQEKLKSFSDQKEFEDYSNDIWLCDDSDGSTKYYKIRFLYQNLFSCWDISYSLDEGLAYYLKDVLNSAEKNRGTTFKSADEFLIYELFTDVSECQMTDDVQYDPEGSRINDSNGQTLGTFLDDGTFECGGDIFHKNSISDFSTAFQEAKGSILLDKYELVTYKDVKYDPLTYLGRYFIISGTAELDDYYNYDYRDLEGAYFCVQITPTGGGYADCWHIYCRRGDEYNTLFENLKKGPAKIMMVCCGYYPDSLKHEMADLIDYYY